MSYQPAEVAVRAGVAPEFVDRLIEVGILKPTDDGYSAGDIRRAALVLVLDRAGLPLEGIAAAIDRGQLSLDFMDASNYDRFSTVTDQTFAQVSATSGVPLDLLMVVREAIGFAEPLPDDRVRDVELRIVPLVAMQVAEGFETATIERWLRVYGESLRRVSETEADWWHTQVEARLMAQGMSPAEMMEYADAHLAAQMAPLLDDALLGIYHGHQEHSWTTSIITGVEAALAEAGVFSRLAHPPAICFLDVTGYTRLTAERGDKAAAQLADELSRIVRRTSARHDGKPIKWLGDGVMFFFRRAGDGVEAALEMVATAQTAGLPPAHVGLHAGPVIFQDGDYFGQTVNLASRIADYARPGEVLVSQAIVDAAEGDAVTYSEIGPVELKGVSGALVLHAARNAAPA
ncbi:MAG TPA: adenylate/guanylate cyclase domain-containing protein [Candidatus Limnocylindrales bacterium]|jgi:adenylate cyclase